MAGVLADLYSRAWWMLLIRGILLVLFGVLAATWPGLALVTMVLLFGIFALAHGVISVVGSVMHRRENQDWWLVLIDGIVSLVIGALALGWPGVTAIVLVYFIAAWALIMGILYIYGAIKLRKVIQGEWLLIISGIISVIFGIFVFARPLAGALAVAWLIGVYAIVFGALGILLSLRIRSWQHKGAAA